VCLLAVTWLSIQHSNDDDDDDDDNKNNKHVDISSNVGVITFK
jgi:hypothetical protein